MNLADITVCLGVDAATVHQLVASLPTWKKHRPELWEMPWLVFAHGIADKAPECAALQRVCSAAARSLTVYDWSLPGVEYETQRERMVTGHVFAPARLARTSWALKIDTDAVALRGGDWLQDGWFAPDARGRYNSIVASPWGYTKAKGGGGSIEAWAIKLEQWGDAACRDGTGGILCPRLGLRDKISGSKIICPRIASWLSLYNVGWLRKLADQCDRYCGQNKLPVPSQDTTAWYFAERMGDRIHRTNMKRYGWTNVSHLDELRETARLVLEQ